MYRFYNDLDYLFVLKKDSYESLEDILNSYYIRKDKEYPYIEFDWDMEYNNNEVKICKEFYSKLQYTLASLYKDTYIADIVGELIGVYDVRVNTPRIVEGNNLKIWQEKLGFTFEDFLTNKKYIVISDSKARGIDEVIDNGFFNWDNIEIAYGNRFTYKNGEFQQVVLV